MTSDLDAEFEPPDELPEVPDALALVLEVDDVMAMFAAQRLRRIDAMRREAMADAEIRGRVASDIVERSVRLELAAALRISESAAGQLMALAEAVVDRYPVVLESLGGARMTERHASILVTALEMVEPAARDGVMTRAVELAESESVGVFRRALRKLIETARSDTLAERHEVALRARRVVVEPAEDGMAWLHAFVPAVEAQAIHGRVTAKAKVLAQQEGETRALDQLRADVLCDLLIDGETDFHPAKARGIRATVSVTVPVLALLAEGGDAAGSEPAIVEGVGPIPIERARELCGEAEGVDADPDPPRDRDGALGRSQAAPPARGPPKARAMARGSMHGAGMRHPRLAL